MRERDGDVLSIGRQLKAVPNRRLRKKSTKAECESEIFDEEQNFEQSEEILTGGKRGQHFGHFVPKIVGILNSPNQREGFTLARLFKMRKINRAEILTGGKRSQHFARFACKIVEIINSPNQRKAFTLAEVLITLAIIGIVAALTIPSVLRNYKANVMEAAFKKGYSAIIQMYNKTCVENNLTYNDVREMLKTEEGITKLREMFYKSNSNLDPTCFDRTNRKECTTGTSLAYKGYKGAGYAYAPNSWFERLPNGMTILFTHPYTQHQYSFAIDTNGFKKGPNWAGYDVFFFYVDSKNNLHPRQDGCSANCSSNICGTGCAYYAVKNECPTDSNLNYWKCLY